MSSRSLRLVQAYIVHTTRHQSTRRAKGDPKHKEARRCNPYQWEGSWRIKVWGNAVERASARSLRVLSYWVHVPICIFQSHIP